MNLALVMSTVNAPHRRQLTARELADALLSPEAAKTISGHMSSFLGEVEPTLQADFAKEFGITETQLTASAKAFAAYSGETYHFAA